MKKLILFTLILGCVSCNNSSNDGFKYNLINKQARALDLACSIMCKHNIYDKDGSDEMSEFLDVMKEVDSLYVSQQ
jgi:hypothetical protein